jgi:hypothetical protein
MNNVFDVCPWSRCISLDTSTDRRLATKKEFEKKNLKTPTFFIVKRDNANPGRGCYMSHLKCMKKALKADQSYALVFEDDVRIRHIRTEVWEEISVFIASHPFDILLLGWCTGDGYRKNMCTRSDKVWGYDYVYKTKCLCTHAVVYSKQFMEHFTEHHAEYPGYEIDDVFAELPGVDVFIVRPALFDQRGDPSTIDDESIERVFKPGM